MNRWVGGARDDTVVEWKRLELELVTCLTLPYETAESRNRYWVD